MLKLLAIASAALVSACVSGPGPASAPAPSATDVIPTVDGAVYIPEGYRESYDSVGYAPVRRAGDTVYVSGVIVYRNGGEGTDTAAFKDQCRRAFRQIEALLKSAGLGFENVAMINSFHVWDTPNFTGTRDEHIAALAAVKAEFMPQPHPAWTAVGTTGLLEEAGIVEIQLIAHVPPSGARGDRQSTSGD